MFSIKFSTFLSSQVDIWSISNKFLPTWLLDIFPILRLLRPFVFVIGFIFFLLFGYFNLYSFKEFVISVAISIFMAWEFYTLVSSRDETSK